MKLVEYLSWTENGLGPENKSRNKQTFLWKEKYKLSGLSVMSVKTKHF